MATSNSFIVPVRRPKEKESKQAKFGDITFVLLSGSVPYGMKSFGPHPLFKLENSTLLDIQIDIINKTFVNCEIILVTGYLADKVIKKRPDNVRIIENQLYETTNECEQMRLAINNTNNENIIFISGNMLFNEKTLSVIDRNKSCLVYETSNQISREEIGLSVTNNIVTSMSYAIDENKWCNIAYFNNKILEKIKYLTSEKRNRKMFMFEIIDSILDKTEIYGVTSPDIIVKKIDSPKDLK